MGQRSRRRRFFTVNVSSHWVLYRSGISHGERVQQSGDSIIHSTFLTYCLLMLVRYTRYPHSDVRTGRDAAYPTPRDRENASGWRDDLLLATGGQRLVILRLAPNLRLVSHHNLPSKLMLTKYTKLYWIIVFPLFKTPSSLFWRYFLKCRTKKERIEQRKNPPASVNILSTTDHSFRQLRK